MIEHILSLILGIVASIIATFITNYIIAKKENKRATKILKSILYKTKSSLDDIKNIYPSYGKIFLLINTNKLNEINANISNNLLSLLPYLTENEITNLNDMLFYTSRIKELLNELKPDETQVEELGIILDDILKNEDAIVESIVSNYFESNTNSKLLNRKVVYRDLINNCYLLFSSIDYFDKDFDYIKVPDIKLTLEFKDK